MVSEGKPWKQNITRTENKAGLNRKHNSRRRNLERHRSSRSLLLLFVFSRHDLCQKAWSKVSPIVCFRLKLIMFSEMIQAGMNPIQRPSGCVTEPPSFIPNRGIDVTSERAEAAQWLLHISRRSPSNYLVLPNVLWYAFSPLFPPVSWRGLLSRPLCFRGVFFCSFICQVSVTSFTTEGNHQKP